MILLGTNEDRDKGDFVGQVSDRTPNVRDLKVNGRLDLVNLFPVVVDASPFLRAWGGAAEMRLRAWRASGDGLRFCVLGRGFSSGDVPGLASKPVETAGGKPLESASLTPLGYDGARRPRVRGGRAGRRHGGPRTRRVPRRRGGLPRAPARLDHVRGRPLPHSFDARSRRRSELLGRLARFVSWLA